MILPEEWSRKYGQGLSSLYESLVCQPFVNMNLVYDNIRLANEVGSDLPYLPKFTGYLPYMLGVIAPDKITLEAFIDA